jgi:flagellar hook protein FlgE
MGDSLLSGVSGLLAHQRMLDVAGDNLANLNTTAFKSSRVTFAELMSTNLREASQPTATSGGTNPMQIGSGVLVASVDKNMTQGSLANTGQPLDMAIEGSGYFVLNNGQTDLYTRVGAFAVDSQYFLVDPATGYRVQRIGSAGVAEGFQDVTSSNIRIPYDIALPAASTQNLNFTGNLSASDIVASTNALTSGVKYTRSGAVVSETTLINQMDQVANMANGDAIAITGTRRDGSVVSTTFTPTVGLTTNQYTSLVKFTAGGTAATAATDLSTLDQVTGVQAGDKLEISGTDSDGTPVSVNYAYTAGDTVQDMLDTINSGFSGATASIAADGQVLLTDKVSGVSETVITTVPSRNWIKLPTDWQRVTTGGDGSTIGDLLNFVTRAYSNPDDLTDQWSIASISNGEIRLTDTQSGFSKTDIKLGFNSAAGDSTMELPSYFKLQTAGGEASKTANVEVFDSQGIGHDMSVTLVKTDIPNKWDMVVNSIAGDVQLNTRRVEGITFLANGSYGGVSNGNPAFQMTFGNDPTNVRTIALDLGTIGQYDGLTQFGSGVSTATISGQDGYAAGWLSSLSVDREGTIVGVFTNGIRRDIASLKIATFQNPAGMSAEGNNYFSSSANSGDPVPVRAMSGGAGAVRGGSLEKSNVEVAAEFVNLIQAQNGYQANARTIKVANDMLSQLTNLIR